METRILLVMAFLTPLAGWAADPVPLDVKLGLWETTLTTQIGMPALPAELLAKLTPEQRAEMEGASTTKHCITKETLNEAFSYASTAREHNCTQTFVTSTSSKRVIHMECTSGTMKTSGDIQVEAINSENTKGSIVMNGGEGGRGVGTKMEFTAKWLGADCGDVGKKKN